jgi:anti-sigma regulatory factor (Ser/Thr protein kinase)
VVGGAFQVTGPDDLARLRSRITRTARSAGIHADRIDRFVVAVHEIAANAIVHGVPPATVRITTTASAFVVTVHDQGSAPGDRPPEHPSVRVPTGPPPLDRSNGRGLWLASRLSDRVEVRSDGEGTTVTLIMGLSR